MKAVLAAAASILAIVALLALLVVWDMRAESEFLKSEGVQAI